MSDIKDENLESPIERHFGQKHLYKIDSLKFMALDRIHPIRGGDFDKSILPTESSWIFNLKATRPPGLNDSISYAPFLQA